MYVHVSHCQVEGGGRKFSGMLKEEHVPPWREGWHVSLGQVSLLFCSETLFRIVSRQ